jgi:hypothetical protein
MARIVPDGWQNLDTATPSIQRELETLRGLSTTLPDDYTVYHGIHWSTLDRGHAVFGEIDFVVVNRAGDLLLIEQKLGFLGETAEGLVKEYPGKSKSVPVQMARSRDAVLTKLRQRNGASHVHVESLLFCPHYAIKSSLTAGIVPERIVDSKRKDQLAAIIQQVLPIGDEMDTVVVHQFLRDVIKLEPDVWQSFAPLSMPDGAPSMSASTAHWLTMLRRSHRQGGWPARFIPFARPCCALMDKLMISRNPGPSMPW